MQVKRIEPQSDPTGKWRVIIHYWKTSDDGSSKWVHAHQGGLYAMSHERCVEVAYDHAERKVAARNKAGGNASFCEAPGRVIEEVNNDKVSHWLTLLEIREDDRLVETILVVPESVFRATENVRTLY